ncbi:hypothetical protein ESCOCP297M_26255 [Escherichia coli]
MAPMVRRTWTTMATGFVARKLFLATMAILIPDM